MHAFTVNYLKRDRTEGMRHPRGQVVNLGFFVHDLPRLIPLCRLLGHRPVVDGTQPSGLTGSTYEHPGHRWVCCDRCGVRGEPQGDLDPLVWRIGTRYQGPWAPAGTRAEKTPADRRGWHRPPGPIERHPTGHLGGQLVVGGSRLGGVGWEVKVGNAGSEHTLAASVHFGWFGSLYLHTEWFGQGVQRRLNPTGYESRLIGVRLSDGRLEWRLWSKRDSLGRHDTEPWWMHRALDLRVRDRLLGPYRYAYSDLTGAIPRVVRMPEADYLVTLVLQRCTVGRRRGRKRRSWTVDWSAVGPGIPTKGLDRGRVSGSGVGVSERAVRADTWAAEAVAAIALRMAEDRTGYGWEPIGKVPIGSPL